jgi:hypothetical protein
MTAFSSEGKRGFPWKSRDLSSFWSEKSPTKKPEDPIKASSDGRQLYIPPTTSGFADPALTRPPVNDN